MLSEIRSLIESAIKERGIYKPVPEIKVGSRCKATEAGWITTFSKRKVRGDDLFRNDKRFDKYKKCANLTQCTKVLRDIEQRIKVENEGQDIYSINRLN